MPQSAASCVGFRTVGIEARRHLPPIALWQSF
jgi:hypothetical protein